MSEPIASFPERFGYALNYYDIKPYELSKRTGVSRAAISQYLSGRMKPKQDRLYVFAQSLHVSPVWLMGYDVPMTPQNGFETIDFENDISQEELSVIKSYRKLDKTQKQVVSDMINGLVKLKE